jgi:hypothetical protein
MLNARDLHNNYPLELHGHHSDAIRDQKHVAADIYFQFAQVSVHFCNHNQLMPKLLCFCFELKHSSCDDGEGE